MAWLNARQPDFRKVVVMPALSGRYGKMGTVNDDTLHWTVIVMLVFFFLFIDRAV